MVSSNILEDGDSQTMTLPDGRTLGYAQYGHPNGYPLIYFHGYPSSRLEGSPASEMLKHLRIQCYCLDRPGFGLSSFQHNRRITDWPHDVLSFADHIGLDKFAVLGGSGGGPYALACAKGIPPGRLSTVGLFAAAGPWDKAGIEDVSWYRYLFHLGSLYWPWGLTMASDATMGSVRWLIETNKAKTWVENWLKTQEKKEAEAKENVEGKSKSLPPLGDVIPRPTSERRERLYRTLLEAFAQGTEPTIQEARLLTTDWGFKFEDITHKRILVWHGTHDTNTSMRMTKYMVERMPHAVLTEYQGENHYQIVKHFGEAVQELITEGMIKEWKLGHSE